MASGVDSLNAAIAASVVMYDVVRRREEHGRGA
jgi:tRNA G18 (ribose-2'-O)-methylase SpoU